MGCEAPICANVRSAHVGTGRETVVLLHGSASSGALWRHTKGALQSSYRCIAPDLIGYGTSAAWPCHASFGLEAELRAIEPLLQCCADTFHLVFFAALKYVGDWTSYLEFCRVRDEFVAALVRGDRELAMRRFVGFWMGNDAWAGLPAGTRANMLKAADKIVLDWQASFAADPGRARLSTLPVRTLLVRGSDSPRPMRSLVDALHAIMPGSARTVVEGANHLLPLTHADVLTSAILSTLRAGVQPCLDDPS